MSRNRIIYQSEALYASLITGLGYSGDLGGNTGAFGKNIYSSGIANLQRVTEISTNSEITRTDVNVFGKLAALSREIIEEPTVSMDFTYYLADAFNETVLGLTVQGTGSYGVYATTGAIGQSNSMAGTTVINAPVNCLSGILANNADAQKNYYILTVQEGIDANGVNPTSAANSGVLGIIGLGNCYLSNYSVNAAVGEIPTASVTVDASNITFALSNQSGINNPAIDVSLTNPQQFTASKVFLPTASTGNLNLQVIRPGDITITFGTALLDAGGAILNGMNANGKQTAHIQNFSLELPLARTPQNRIGNAFSFSKELDVPINVTLNVSANLADLSTGSLIGLICEGSREIPEITIKMYAPCGAGDETELNMMYILKGATLDSQNMASTIGDNKTVDLVFTTQIGGPNDQSKGLFISGKL